MNLNLTVCQAIPAVLMQLCSGLSEFNC